MRIKRQPLVCQFLEHASSQVLETHGSHLRDLVGRSHGVYSLYKRDRLYYVGLASNLRGRLDQHLRDRAFAGGARGSWNAISKDIVKRLPNEVYISFDIDGLTPEHCPNTGTPVPGGLTFPEVCHLLEVLAKSGKRVVGFDLCEVAPGARGEDWNANVGARVLYKLLGCTLKTQGLLR